MSENRATATEVMNEALNADIRRLLDELGNPPLVDRIFPNGWESAPRDGRLNLHALCLRTFAARGAHLQESASVER